MAQSKKRSPGGLLSEAAKKSAQAVGDAARRVVGKKRPGAKSPAGNLSEAARQLGITRVMIKRRIDRFGLGFRDD